MTESNLTTKNIKEFKAGDSIHARVLTQAGQFSTTYVCEFVEHINEKKVKVKIINNTNRDNYKDRLIRDQEEIEVQHKNLSLFGKGTKDKRERFHSLDQNGFFCVENDFMSEEDEEIPKSHESYGIIGISRYSSSGKVPLFGSPLQHKQCISFTLKKAEVERSLHSDSYYGRQQIVQFDMSEAQFAELITSPNRGDGVPCTIKNLQGKRMESPPFKSYADKLLDEFKAKMHNISAGFESSVDSINQILEKKSVGKADKEEIKKHIKSIDSFLNSSLPFVAGQFQEQTDEAVSKAKIELISFVNEAARKVGIDSKDFQNVISIGKE